MRLMHKHSQMFTAGNLHQYSVFSNVCVCLWLSAVTVSSTGAKNLLQGDDNGHESYIVCVFITAGPMIKLCAGGEGDSEGHVL